MKQGGNSIHLALDMESIGKKIGKLEVTTSHLQKQINTEGITKQYVDAKAEELNIILQHEVTSLKKGFDQLATLLTESVENIKSNLTEDIDFKTNNISKLVESTLERVDYIDQGTINQSQEQINLSRNVDMKLKQFNTYMTNELKQFSTELNTAMTKIGFFEKKIDEQSSALMSKVDTLSKDMKDIRKAVDSLLTYKDNSNKAIEHLQTEFSATQEINSKFNFQTSILIEEVKGKMKKSESIMKEQISQFEAIKKAIYSEISNFQGNVNTSINKINAELISQNATMKNEIKEFQLKIKTLNDDTEKYVHKQINELCLDIKTMFESNSTEIAQLKERHYVFEEKVSNKHKDFFDNLNEIEEFMNKKYESVMRVVNQASY